jgi:aspartyl-tRNA(Asn)/glutamyl-tRNA(Gln) amidotransferase subunit C
MADEKISPELFAHLVDLAAIALDPTQSEYLRSQLNKQLEVIEELKAIPIDESIPGFAWGGYRFPEYACITQ